MAGHRRRSPNKRRRLSRRPTCRWIVPGRCSAGIRCNPARAAASRGRGNAVPMMDYGDVVACAPVTVPYVRRSDKGAAWWLGSALLKLLEVSGLDKPQIDGLCLSSFTLAPDGPAPFAQYVGLSPRFLEFLPFGGACGVMALRRAG